MGFVFPQQGLPCLEILNDLVRLEGGDIGVRLVSISMMSTPKRLRAFEQLFKLRSVSLVCSAQLCPRTTPIAGVRKGACSSMAMERPVRTEVAKATSATDLANRPTVSSDQEKSFTPTLGSRLALGLKPVTPQ